MNKRGVLMVVSGPAGVGKGTVCKQFLKDNPEVKLSVSATTRSPRPGEEHGREYYFLSKEEFEEKIKSDNLLEYVCFVGNYYGTLKSAVEEKLSEGIDVLLEIEVEGAMNVKKKFPDSVLVFVLPPSFDELAERLKGRGTETPEVIEKRLARAMEEFECVRHYDYVLLNDTIENAAEKLKSILTAEKMRIERNKMLIEEAKK
ncbi:MAG: guanylate kinase [Clostridia bacterium]|nr:guanylate kinase [Clostridia bacterium]